MAILARDEQLDLTACDNAFGLPQKWVTRAVDPISPTVTAPLPTPNQKRVDSFRQHRLNAVMVGKRGYANLDGQGVFIGEFFDDFKLVSVTKTAAVFELEGSRVELRLTDESKLNRKGSVIENAAPRNSATPLK